MAYPGEGAYAGLKVGAVVGAAFSVILAIALWVGADEPHIEIDALGSPFVSNDLNPVVVAAGIIVLGEGILLALVLWAVGTIGNHVIVLRRQLAPMDDEPVVARPAPSVRPTPQHAAPPATGSTSTYGIVLVTKGTASPQQLGKIVRRYSGRNPDWRIMLETDVMIASGLSYAYADTLREDLERAGAVVELREDPQAE